MTVLNTLMNNIYLYWGIIIGLLLVDISLTTLCLGNHKREKIKKDFLEIEKEEAKPANEEIMDILKKMEEDSKLKPEEVVKKFEDDQEQNAIISYQELLDSVNNETIEIEENDEGEIDFVKQLEAELNIQDKASEVADTKLESELLATIDNMDNKEVVDKVEEAKEDTHLDVIDELNNDKKFTSSEVISPVFGRISDFTNYSLHKNMVEVKQVAGTSPEEELKNNEAFLKALIKFRNNL